MIQVGDQSPPTEEEEEAGSRYLSVTGAGAGFAGTTCTGAGMKVVVEDASRECDGEGRDVDDLNELTRWWRASGRAFGLANDMRTADCRANMVMVVVDDGGAALPESGMMIGEGESKKKGFVRNGDVMMVAEPLK